MFELYKLRCKELTKNELINYNELNNYDNFKDLMSEEEFKQVISEKIKRSKKRNRTHKKILDMIKFLQMNDNFKMVFGTLTLNNKELENKERTRVKKIDSYLRQHYEVVIINKDYGDKTEREHYHFIGITKEDIMYIERKSKKGFPLFTLTRQNYTLGHEPDIEYIDTQNIDKIRNYLLKLNNHSNKITTKNRIRVLKNASYELWELINLNNSKIKIREIKEKNKKITLNDNEIERLFEYGTI